jgi:hypothetical protein
MALVLMLTVQFNIFVRQNVGTMNNVICQLSSFNPLLYVLFWWAKKYQKSPQTTENTAPPSDPP